MAKFVAFIAGFVTLAALMVGAPESHAREAKSRSAASNRTQLYFIYPKGLGIAIVDAEVSIDGGRIAAVRQGSFHVTGVRPGSHQIQVENALSSAFRADIRMASGRSRYFVIGPVRSFGPGFQALTTLLAGTKGDPVPGRYGLNPGLSLYAVDAAQGRAMIAKLRRTR